MSRLWILIVLLKLQSKKRFCVFPLFSYNRFGFIRSDYVLSGLSLKILPFQKKRLKSYILHYTDVFQNKSNFSCLKKEKIYLDGFWGAEVFCFGSCSHAAFAYVFCIFHKWLYLFYGYFVLYHFAEVFFMTWMRLNFRQNLHLKK